MGHPDPVPVAASGRRTRLAAVGVVVFLANAALLVLQLTAGRLLAPFVGSSLETWTSVIGAFLAGIAVGNAVGGRAADRHPTGRRLAACLIAGAFAALWMIAFPHLLTASGFHRSIPLSVRIPLLALLLCFPAGFTLSLPTPLAIRLGMPDIRRAGRVAGLVFALGTLGCLAGNYLTGFYLLPTLTIDGIAYTTAGLLVASAGLAWLTVGNGMEKPGTPSCESTGPRIHSAMLPIPRAFLVVFLCSFAGMTLELTAARLMAQILGVPLYTWTGIIGVMLAGTAAGNWFGGMLADRAGKSLDSARGMQVLSWSLTLAAVAGILVLLVFFVGVRLDLFEDYGVITRVLAWTFVLFFPAMLTLGTITPQVIRLAVPDLQHAGRVAGRVYGVSMAGSIAGTFLTGFVLVSAVGVYRTVLLSAVLPAVAAVLATRAWERSTLLYALSIVGGSAFGGFFLLEPANAGIARETNYYTIRVTSDAFPKTEQELAHPDACAALALAGPAGACDPPGVVYALQLDRLTHSRVKPTDPTFLFYTHEQIQMEILRNMSRKSGPDRIRVLVVGGGGYTFPRCARTLVPSSGVDVVEIDPGVTAVSYERLGLDPALGIVPYHMDGRQFLAERAAPGHYDLITLDAVNDLTVPYHLLTREFNEEVRKSLAPNGVYLLTVIDYLEDGQLWKAAVHTLRETFPHVQVLTANPDYRPTDQQVYVLYAAAEPLDVTALREAMFRLSVANPYTHALPPGEQDRLLTIHPRLVLTDQFAPVDNLMAQVFRRRKDSQPEE